MARAQWLTYLMQPGVIWTGLLGTALQLVLGVANNFNVAGLGDLIAHYGLNGVLASGALVALMTGLFYSLTERGSGNTVATGAGAAAGGVSGTLGLAFSQAFGITPVAAGALPVIDFTMLGTMLASLVGLVEPAATGAATAAAATPAVDTLALTQVFTMTAAGGGVGAFVGRFFTGHHTRRRSRRPRHAHS